MDGRPYGRTSDSRCTTILLTHPRRELQDDIRSKVALPEKLASRTVLLARNSSITVWRTPAICEAEGSGEVVRDPSTAKQSRSSLGTVAERLFGSNKIKNAAVICTAEGTKHACVS